MGVIILLFLLGVLKICVLSLLVVKKGPFKHHHNELYFHILRIEVFRNICQVLSKHIFFVKYCSSLVERTFFS